MKFLPSIPNRFEGGAAKQKSGNLYQIFTYINNWKKEPDETVAGMLLYAKTTSPSLTIFIALKVIKFMLHLSIYNKVLSA
ncbi:hypothetical protein QNH10_10235 [Sporosarcina thermotolerans]|uniref:hypothetical protein n=1 Tax=Sporosarcina thermotolerans TaxID=633404 RepID=UPI0024BCB690|nr:hypothetical protein [Sporosarcina thermotolerans]WHT49791.1 hypothetical protein QNH10_10235 [Sporosarcina thermotolerans]